MRNIYYTGWNILKSNPKMIHLTDTREDFKKGRIQRIRILKDNKYILVDSKRLTIKSISRTILTKNCIEKSISKKIDFHTFR